MLCCVVLCCVVLCCVVLCIVLYCIVLYCIVLYCIVLASASDIHLFPFLGRHRLHPSSGLPRLPATPLSTLSRLYVSNFVAFLALAHFLYRRIGKCIFVSFLSVSPPAVTLTHVQFHELWTQLHSVNLGPRQGELGNLCTHAYRRRK